MLLWIACSIGVKPTSTSDPEDLETETTPPVPTPPGFDASAGFEFTADGAVNRIADVPSSPADYAYGASDCYGSSSASTPECEPSSCTERPNGRCAFESCLTSWCLCVYACTSDADCAPDEACLRPEHGLEAGLPLPQCVPADCRTGADCESGECGVSRLPSSATEQLRLSCRAPSDLCRVDSDCEEIGSGDICSNIGEWDCVCSICWCD